MTPVRTLRQGKGGKSGQRSGNDKETGPHDRKSFSTKILKGSEPFHDGKVKPIRGIRVICCHQHKGCDCGSLSSSGSSVIANKDTERFQE
jgi:hypothetical protein